MTDQRKVVISHPGQILKEAFLDEMSITTDTAVGLGRFFNTDPQNWVNLQSHYGVVMAESTVDFSSIKTLEEIKT